MKKLLLAALATLLPSIAHAGTFTVDFAMGPGADFQGVQEALDSSLVVDGDTLLIRPGSYLHVNTSKSVSMIGLGASPDDVDFFKGFFLQSTFKNCVEPMSFTNLRFINVYFEDCMQMVHLSEVEMRHLSMRRADHVRVENEVLDPANFFSLFVYDSSNAEFLRCSMRGDFGYEGLYGDRAALVKSDSYARFADCVVRGGDGGDYLIYTGTGGDGGTGLVVEDNSRVHLVGAAGNFVRGGNGGWGIDIPSDGNGGSALQVDSSSVVRRSNFELAGGVNPYSGVATNFLWGPASSLHTVPVPDPLLTRSGSFTPGSTSTFHMLGEPGATTIAFFGLSPQSTPLTGIIGHLATNFTGPFVTGQTDGLGSLSFSVVMPIGVPIGTLATMQSGMVYTSDGSARLSNPTTIWVQ